MSVGRQLNSVRYGSSRIRMIGGDVDGNREKDDFYPTPPEGTQALLRVESFVGDIWEPACGDGAISKVLEAAGNHVISSDLVDRGYGTSETDFLLCWEPQAPNIVTNPPFKLAVPFVRHALALSTSKVAMLLKIAFLEGRERAALFAEHPPARVWVFSQRLGFHRGGDATQKVGGGMMAFAWFVWDHSHSGPPVLGWL